MRQTKHLRHLSILAGLICLCAALYLVVWELGRELYFNPRPPVADYATPRSPAEAMAQDLDYLRHFLDLDRSYTDRARDEALRLIATLKATVDDLSLGAFELGIARVAALADNGHTQVYLGPRSRRLQRLPIRTVLFEDGLHILWAHAEHVEFLGARIDRIGGLRRLSPTRTARVCRPSIYCTPISHRRLTAIGWP
ncbi:hypothetical protein [Candidatus Rhodobacter oscarellae]|uniref:hypothetical protein n=1 Tax=Candidatus Rhodobacter oscarellae TaxID=1675527 RepID=UPI000670D8A0|nr:hypothetical protein [Candidatus Rhodobacter lobularis]